MPKSTLIKTLVGLIQRLTADLLRGDIVRRDITAATSSVRYRKDFPFHHGSCALSDVLICSLTFLWS